MFKVAISGWLVEFSRDDKSISLSVTNVDGTPVVDTEADIGGGEVLGYRLTSESTDAASESGDGAKANIVKQKLWVGDLQVELVNDAYNYLNLYLSHAAGGEVEHNYLTNGTGSSKSCDIEVTI